MAQVTFSLPQVTCPAPQISRANTPWSMIFIIICICCCGCIFLMSLPPCTPDGYFNNGSGCCSKNGTDENGNCQPKSLPTYGVPYVSP